MTIHTGSRLIRRISRRVVVSVGLTVMTLSDEKVFDSVSVVEVCEMVVDAGVAVEEAVLARARHRIHRLPTNGSPSQE